MAKGNRRFTLTINSDEITLKDDAKGEALRRLKEAYHDVVYFAVGEENAPTTGKKHLHAFVEFENQKSANAVSKVFANAHYEVYTEYDNGATAFEYLSKEDHSPLEYGKRKFRLKGVNSCERSFNGYEGAVNAILQGLDLVEVIKMYPEIALRHYASLKAIYSDFCGAMVVKDDSQN